MIKFKYRYCKVYMAQYLSGDLSDANRRRIARYIDECDDCYNEYIRQRNLANQLERDLPALGRPSAQALDNIWSQIQTELSQPAQQNGGFHKHLSQHTLGYGIIMLMMVMLMATQIIIGVQSSSTIIDLPPRPQTVTILRTPTVVAQNNEVVLAVTQSTVPIRLPLLQNTPAPNFRQ